MYTNKKYTGLVWIICAISLSIYGALTIADKNVPGIEQLVESLSSVHGGYIYGAAFTSILIEGLYVIGNFFPGSTLIVIIAVISQTGGPFSYILTIFTIFLGWCVAGVINIICARWYSTKLNRPLVGEHHDSPRDFFVTWFPVFRANYEVAQILEGVNSKKTFLDSTLVKFIICIIMLGLLSIIPMFIDITSLTNREGAISLFFFAGVSLAVGISKFK